MPKSDIFCHTGLFLSIKNGPRSRGAAYPAKEHVRPTKILRARGWVDLLIMLILSLWRQRSFNVYIIPGAAGTSTTITARSMSPSSQRCKAVTIRRSSSAINIISSNSMRVSHEHFLKKSFFESLHKSTKVRVSAAEDLS